MKENSERLTRNKYTNEFFSPNWIIEKIISDDEFKVSINQNYVEPCVGSGRILVRLRDNLISQGYNKTQVLKKLWGCDILPRNCLDTIENVFGIDNAKILSYIPNKYKTPGLKHIFIVENKIFPQIVCADSLIYNMSFFGQPKQEFLDPNKLFEII